MPTIRATFSARVPRSPNPCCAMNTTPTWISSPIPLKITKSRPSRPTRSPRRCLNAQCRLPMKAKIVATMVAIVVDVTGLSLAPECSAFVPASVMTVASIPTMPNFVTSWIITRKRV